MAPPAQPADPGANANPAKPQAGAPAEFDISLPDGTQYDSEAIGDFKKIIANDKLTPKEKAEQILALDQKAAQKANEAFSKKVQDLRTKDIETLKAHKEYGGVNYDATKKAAESSMQQFFGENGSKILKAAGLDNQPDIVIGLAMIRKAVAEDQTKPPGTGNGKEPQLTKPTTQTERLAGVYSAVKKK